MNFSAALNRWRYVTLMLLISSCWHVREAVLRLLIAKLE